MARRARAAIALLALVPFLAAAQTPSRRALLTSGADPIKGLPFFPPNALAGLVGSYDLGLPAPTTGLVKVWYTRESLVLGPAWRRSDEPQASGPASGPVLVLATVQGTVYCLEGQGYRLFLEPPASAGDADRAASAAWQAFFLAFTRKFQLFFQDAATDAELSFPAFVDY